ncbi:hypothetical protein D3C78_765540 [compost metagenome]
MLDQRSFSQELLDTTVDHVGDDVLRLALHLLFVQLHEYSLLALDCFSRDFRWIQELWVAGSHVHGDFFGQLDVAALQDNSNTDLVTVQVGTDNVAFNAHQATDVDVLTNLGNQGFTSAFLSGDQRSGIGQLFSEGFFNAGVDEVFEVVLQSQEVGLRVHFQQDGGFVVSFDSDSAFSGNVAGLFSGLDGARSAHVVNGFLDVAAGLFQGLFAIHHAFAGTLTQFFDQRCSNCCHFKFLLDRFSTIPPDT